MDTTANSILDDLERQLDEIEQTWPMVNNFARIKPYIVRKDEGGLNFEFILYHKESEAWFSADRREHMLTHLAASSFVRPSDIIWDIYCNSGLYLVWFALTARHGHIYGFDPLPWNVAATRAQAALNGCSNVTIFQVGPVGAEDRKVPVLGNHPPMRSGIDKNGPSDPIFQPKRVDQFVTSAAPTFLKVHSVGLELEFDPNSLISGASVERGYVVSYPQATVPDSPKSLIQALAAAGYDIRKHTPWGDRINYPVRDLTGVFCFQHGPREQISPRAAKWPNLNGSKHDRAQPGLRAIEWLQEQQLAETARRLDRIESVLSGLRQQLGFVQTQLGIASMVSGCDRHELQRRILRLGSLIRPQRAIGRSKRRVGGPNDGGYVMLDDFEGIRSAISFGIGTEDSWDRVIADSGIVVHQYDHTVEGPPTDHPNFRFSRQKVIADQRLSEGVSLASAVSGAAPEDSSVILKIDIEGAEWDVFAGATRGTLDRCAQIVCEFHGFGSVYIDGVFARMEKALLNLHTIFAVVHVHANNGGPWQDIGNVPFPSTLEVSFANRSRYKFQENDEIFPSELDGPNSALFPDLYLGSFDWPTPRA